MELLYPAEEDTVDELGLGRLADAIADRLYPATTVLMTRPRYLYLVTAIYRHLEDAATPPVRFEAELKRLEDRLREALLRRTDEAVIGRRAKENLKRYPSSIYWRALSQLGFLTAPVSQRQYLQRLIKRADYESVTTDDATSISEEPEGTLWTNEGGVDALKALSSIARKGTGSKTAAATTLDLTKREAIDLRSRYVESENATLKNSLLAFRLKNPTIKGPDWPWECATTGSPQLAELLWHAERVSTFARGATLLYFGLLLDKRKDQAQVQIVRAAFSRWWVIAAPLLKGWDTDQAVALFPNTGSVDDSPFLKEWTSTITTARSGKSAWEDGDARTLVRKRDERRAKSRLRNQMFLQQWDSRIVAREVSSAQQSPYRMTFRHYVSNRVVHDVASALRGRK